MRDQLQELLEQRVLQCVSMPRNQLHECPGIELKKQSFSNRSAEIVRAKALDRVYIGTDYFDGSINRVGALALGARTIYKALLYALLEPTERLKGFEEDNDLFSRLAFLEDLKTAPVSAVWEKFCQESGVPGDFDWAESASDYEIKVLNSR